MKKFCLFLLFFFFTTNLSGAEEIGSLENDEVLNLFEFYSEGSDPYGRELGTDVDYHVTTLFALKLFAPQYDQKKVFLNGYLFEYVGGLFLVPTEADARMQNVNTGLRVITEGKYLLCKDNYVTVMSEFIYDPKNSKLGLYNIDSMAMYIFEENKTWFSNCHAK